MSRPVHVIVVAYRRADLLELALAGLGGEFTVSVVDNSSEPEVRAVAERHRADYLDPGRNAGFGAGVNVALRRLLEGDPCDVLLLNPDARTTPADVRRLAAALHAPGAERLGMVTPRLLDAQGSPQRAIWPFPSPWRAWVEAVGLGRLNRAAGFAVGTVLLLRWEAVEQVRLFDERFFLYAEETDWQRRAVDLGWTAAQVDGATAEHEGGATSADPARRERLFHAGTETYLRKWHGAAGWQVYRSAVVLGAAARGVLLCGDRRELARERRRLFLQGPRRAAGSESG